MPYANIEDALYDSNSTVTIAIDAENSDGAFLVILAPKLLETVIVVFGSNDAPVY